MKIILETERLIACRYTMDDLQQVYDMQQDPEVVRYIYDGKMVTWEEEKQRLQERIAYYDQQPGLGVFKLLLKSDHSFIGAGNLNHINDGQDVEIGYVLRKEFWGQGFASEISQALVDHAFKTLDLDQIVGITELGNAGSEKILLKNGFQLDKQYTEGGIKIKEYLLTKKDYLEHQQTLKA